MSPSASRALLGAIFGLWSAKICAVDFGRTVGAFDVTPGGAAAYTIPIWTPPGPNGLTPSIALTYSSQSGNGSGGVGWHISAVSSIDRCARTTGQDGSDEAVALTTADRFCIGGNRLRLSSGTYGAANSVYFTELADYSRVTAFGTAGNGPQYFIVEAKSGLKFEYGNTTDSRVFPGVSPAPIATTPSQWMLNKVYDRNGNKYVISYLTSSGFARPDTISWTPTSLGAATYQYEAKFNYSPARTNADTVFGRIAGFSLEDRYRLENVQIKSAGVVKRKYRLTYDTSATTSRSRLTAAKECADDAEANCFLPLTFTYQTGQVGVTAGSSAPPTGSSNNLIKGRYDFNGDGKHDVAYWGGTTWQVVLSTNSGFAGPYNTGITAANVLVDTFLPTGRAALLASNSGVLWTYRWDDTTSSFTSYNTGVSSVLPTSSLDYNGDGLADLVYFISGANYLQVRKNTSTGSGNPSFNSTASTTATIALPRTFAYIAPYGGQGLYRIDVNGDGRQDLNARILYVGMGGGTTTSITLLGSNTGFDLSPEVPYTAPEWPGINFNGDRCTDRFVSGVIQIAACSGATATTVTSPANGALYDWNGDGRTDVVVGGGVYLSTGVGFSSLIPASPATGGFSLDIDGDGLDDMITPGSPGSAFSYWTHTASGAVPTYATNIPDLLSGATDGFGVTYTPNYASTAWTNYDKGATTSLPLQESKPAIVVAQVTSTNGVGSTFNKSYFYVGARDDVARGSSAGFQRIDETDGRNGIISRTYFEQTFPVSGMVSQKQVMQPNGVTEIASAVFTNSFATLDSTPNNQRFFSYPQGSTARQYELGGVWNGSLLRTTTTANLFDTTSGALYDQTVSTTEPASGANGVNAGAVWTARTYSPLANLVNDTTNWCLGRPGRTQKINSHNLTYSSSITRTTDILWNSTLCRPTQILDEPGDPDLQVTTGIGHDGFGNVNSTTVTGIGMTGRTTSSIYSDATYTTGQFPLSVTNALSQTSTNSWNYDLGVPLSTTNPNGLTESRLYDAFGRRTKETRTDGTATTWSFNNCSTVAGGCVGAQNQTVVIETELTNIGGFIKDTWAYLDRFDRAIVGKTRLLSGVYNRVDREFDALGRLYRESTPCVWTACTTYWITNTYDLANRTIQVSRPISDANPTLQNSYTYHEGLTTRAVDAQSKQSTRIANAVGELARSTDHDDYYQAFDYDAFSEIKRVQDGAGNTLQSSNYNVRGMLLGRADMEMGTWAFKPNALGEVLNIRDAKTSAPNWTQTLAYDSLGRLTGRTEAEGTSTWTWGTSSAAKNIGLLASLSGPGYSESYTYTALSQIVSRLITAGGSSYQFNFGHNTQGKLDNITYPISTSGYRLALKFDYQNGEPYRIRDLNALTTVFWIANASDARNQITQETLSNGLVTNRSTDAVTGWLKSIQTGLSGGTGVQNLAYEWDLAGNLKKRKDVNQSNLTEDFYFDNLYRLDYSQRNGATNLDMGYDALGNIQTKSDVGTYTYHATKKHQVTSTSNGWSFGYDNNGNMTSGRGATMTWTSFNYPASITNGADTTSFSYTPDRQYWQQVSNYTSGGAATTIYVGGVLEKVTTSAGTDYRHMIRAGGSTIIVSRKSSGVNTINYVTSDHLGSSSAITDSSGGILVNSSFDAFGKRRGSNWTGSPSAGDWTAIAGTTRRSYTEHTMLDNLNLIHMNGRVQDPWLGRFSSADPFITEFGNTQNYNRYSYVFNNPLRFTDPSGFCGFSPRFFIPSFIPSGSRTNPSPEVLQEVVVTATRTLCSGPWMDPNSPPGGTPQGPPQGPPPQVTPGTGSTPTGEPQGDACNSDLIRWGNNIAQFSANMGDASSKVMMAGLATTGVGAITLQPEVAAVGVAMTGTGGLGGVVSGVAQFGAGLLQGFGGAGYSNSLNAIVTLGAGAFIGRGIRGPTPTGSRSASERAGDSLRNNTAVVVGGVFNAVTSFLQDVGPQQKSCTR